MLPCLEFGCHTMIQLGVFQVYLPRFLRLQSVVRQVKDLLFSLFLYPEILLIYTMILQHIRHHCGRCRIRSALSISHRVFQQTMSHPIFFYNTNMKYQTFSNLPFSSSFVLYFSFVATFPLSSGSFSKC